MKLLTYAVSQKLNSGNDMWRFVKENQPIPVNIVEDAFLETIENFSDIKATRLVSSYTDFITHHVPVTFIPNESGVQVSGEIQDEALEVIGSFYGQTREDVIRETIESSIHTISPEREIEILDIETMVSEFRANVMDNHKRIEKLSNRHNEETSAVKSTEVETEKTAAVKATEKKEAEETAKKEVVEKAAEKVEEKTSVKATEKVVEIAKQPEVAKEVVVEKVVVTEEKVAAKQPEVVAKETHNIKKSEDVRIVDDAPATVVVETEETALDKASKALKEAELRAANPGFADIDLDDIVLDDNIVEIEAEKAEESVEKADKVVKAEESEKEKEAVTETGLLASVWNHFVTDIKENELDERLNLTTPLTMAVV